MAKKKLTSSKRGTAKKKVAAKKKKKGPAKAAAKKKAPAKSKAIKKKTVPTKKKKVSLGRPKVTGEEKLFMLFHDNYHARQIFEYLRVETVKELEEFSPDEIIQRVSQPIQFTVQRIREELAAKNRCLAGDAVFAAKFARDSKDK